MIFFTAEFIIDLAEEHHAFEDFKRVLLENGAEFSDSFITNLLRIIQLMKPSPEATHTSLSNLKADTLAFKFPGLAIKNKLIQEEDLVVDGAEEEEEKKKKPIEIVKNVETVAEDMMAELEMFAPKSGEADKQEASAPTSSSREKPRERSRSRERRRSRSRERKRSRSRERRRSRSADRKRKRSRSRDRPRRRSRSRDRRRDRSRDRSAGKRRSRSGSRSRRNRSRDREDSRRHRSPAYNKKRSPSPQQDDPEAGHIYSGRVANIVPFGCFVQILGLKKRWEGLVHISQLRSEGRVMDATEVVSRNQMVKVKVMSVAGQKVSLSMKEVDQDTGADLNDSSHAHLRPENDTRDRNPDRPVGGTSMLHLEGGNLEEEEDQTRKRVTRISSPERWEIKQMISSGVIDRSELPDFDEETGLLPKDEDDEADIEIEIVEEEPPFLQGHGRALNDLSPVRIVKNPDGSLAQAAMMQSALAKERREHKMLQREQEMDTIPTSLNKNWIDPLPDGKYMNPI